MVTGENWARRWVPAVVVLLFGVVLPALGLEGPLQEELNKVHEAGLSGKAVAERLERLEEAAMPLLAKAQTPEQKGQIYAILGATFAQSGQVTPAKTVEYVKKALEYPQEPLKKTRLLTYWGDAVQVANAGARGQQLAAARREAAVPYLMVLKEMLTNQIPAEKPEAPMATFFTYGGPKDSPEAARLRAEQEAQAAAQARVRFQRNMIVQRQAATDQIVFLYSRLPFATGELERLAQEVLQDKDATARLVAQVKARVKDRLDKMGENELRKLPKQLENMTDGTPGVPDGGLVTRPAAESQALGTPAEKATPALGSTSEPSPYWWWGLGVIVAITVTAAIFIAVRRMSARQPGG